MEPYTRWREACERCREEREQGQHRRSPSKAEGRPRPRTLRPSAFFRPTDLPHSARWECSECDELIREELPLHLAQEWLGHPPPPPP